MLFTPIFVYASDTNIAHILKNTKQYLQQRINHNKQHKKLAIVFNLSKKTITHLQNTRKTHFSTPPGIFHDVSTYKHTPIAPMLSFYKFVAKNHIAIFFVINDDHYDRNIIIKNLSSAGYRRFKKIYLTRYAANIRKRIINQGYNIVLNVDDQHNHLERNYADKTIVIPKTYYFCS